MKYNLVKTVQFSGSKASVYSLYSEVEKCTLFERFLEENEISFKSELIDILLRLNTIANKEGAREHYFKTREGKPGDLVCALYDIPNSHLRLYCIRFGSSLIILGGGGYKPKYIKALQQDPKLNMEQKIMVTLSDNIFQRLKDKELCFVNDFKDFEGDLNFEF